jgi:hypothetical protein
MTRTNKKRRRMMMKTRLPGEGRREARGNNQNCLLLIS